MLVSLLREATDCECSLWRWEELTSPHAAIARTRIPVINMERLGLET